MVIQDLKRRWELHAVEPLPNTSEKGPDKEDPIKFKCAAHHMQTPRDAGVRGSHTLLCSACHGNSAALPPVHVWLLTSSLTLTLAHTAATFSITKARRRPQEVH